MNIYRVGGAVRDQLLGLPVNDVDWVVVGATPQQMLDQGFQQVGRDFPVFLHPETKQEYALARTERKTAPGYTGFVVHTDPNVSLEQDLARRDLTINAMAQDGAGTITDPYHGQRDLEQRVLRHVTDAFVEDPLRVLRVARFAARFSSLGFYLAPETLNLMQTMTADGELGTLVAERVWVETNRALAEADPLAYFDVLDECAALQQVFPEIASVWRQGTPSARELLNAIAQVDPSVDVSNLSAAPGRAELRFAAIAMTIDHDSFRALVDRLRVPKSYSQLAELAAGHIDSLHRFTSMDAEQRLHLLESMDVLRRPQRIQSLLPLARCHWQLLHEGVTDYPQADLVLKAIKQISLVTSADLVEQGIAGPAMAQALRLKRLQALASA